MKKINRYFLIAALLFVFGSICVVKAQSDPIKYANGFQKNLLASASTAADSQVDSQNNLQGINQINPQDNFQTNSQTSSIEQNLNSDINDLKGPNQLQLKQIGYDLFSNNAAIGSGKYDGSYQLNIGEKINVYIWGDSVDMLSISGSPVLAPLTQTQVDTKGNIFVPGIGMVKADGQTISGVESQIQSLASQKFTNVKVRITVADSTQFPIFVYGYVNKPGKILIGANTSILEALAAAGGVSKNGSLRNVTYKSSGQSQSLDLYSIILQGKDANIRPKFNDTIYVNSIGTVVAVKNGVKIPGIYEVKPTDSISDIINFAGGFAYSTDKSVVNIKAYNTKEGQRVSKDVSSEAFKKTRLANGDILEFRNSYGRAENVVSLQGNVKHPAIYSYKAGMRLSDVLKSKNELQDETFTTQAVIKRIVGDKKELISIPVSLEDFFNGGNNPALQPKDIITVYKNTNSNFVEVYGCIDKPKQVPYKEGLTLKDVLADTQFIQSSSNVEINNKNKNESNMKNIANIASNNEILPASDIAVEIINGDSEKTLYLYDLMVQNDALQNTVINQTDKIFFRPLREDEIIKTVKISGYVYKPGVYKFVEGKRLSDTIATAGGLTKNANLKGIVFKRASLAQKQKEAIMAKDAQDVKLLEGQMAGDTNASRDDSESRQQVIDQIANPNKDLINKNVGRIVLNIKDNNLSKLRESENIDIQDGDEIYIPKISNHVMVIGEVYNETSFVYKKGEKASYYIDLVGGFTPNARRTKIYKISANGRACKLKLMASNSIEPGDTIVVPRKLRTNDWITPLASTLQSIASVLTSVFIVTNLKK